MRYFKENSKEKFDSHLLKKPEFIHTNWMVAKKMAYFSAKICYKYGENVSQFYGVDSKMHRLSSYGIVVDICDVGKSNE
jgi:hypothetical protein